MTQAVPSHRPSRLDVVLVLATLLAAFWVASRTEKELETSLGLSSTQWLRDMGDAYIKQAEQARAPWASRTSLDDTLYDRASISISDTYALGFTTPPVNVTSLSQLTSRKRAPVHIIRARIGVGTRETTVPFLTIASVGLGFVATRRTSRARRRARWGPGRVAAAISLLISGIGLAQVFVLRRFDLMRFGLIHDSLAEFWESNARIVAVATLAAWIILALNGRWRLERTWREWLGASLGGLWLADLLCSTVIEPFFLV